jgi:hypothetical protein
MEAAFLDPVDPEDVLADLKEAEQDRTRALDGVDKSNVRDTAEIVAPTLRPKGNTGVKGVLADYAEAKERARIRHERNQEKIMKETHNIIVAPQVENASLDDEEFITDEIMEQFKQQRITELQQQQKQNSKTQARKTFGFFSEITQGEYVDAIDSEAADIFVLVHLYSSKIPACYRLNQCLSKFAIKYPYIKCLRITTSQAKPNYPVEGLPTLMVYRAKTLYTSFVPINSFIPEDFTVDDLAILLYRNNIVDRDPSVQRKTRD